MKQTDDLVKAVFTKEAPQHLLLFVSVRIAAAIIVRFVMRLLWFTQPFFQNMDGNEEVFFVKAQLKCTTAVNIFTYHKARFSFFWCLREMQKVIWKDRLQDGHELYLLAGGNVICMMFRELFLPHCTGALHIDISLSLSLSLSLTHTHTHTHTHSV